MNPMQDEDILPPVQSVSSSAQYNEFLDGSPPSSRRQPQSYDGIPDFSDGGTYEDNFGQTPKSSNSATLSPKNFSSPTSTKRNTSSDANPFDAENPFASPSTNPKSGSTDDNPFDEESRRNSSAHMLDSKSPAAPETPAMPWHVTYYSKFFDVDTQQVLQRVLLSLLPYPPKFFASIRSNPDLYGPFWISTTLIFLLAASGNFARWLDNSKDYEYEFNQVSAAAGAIYGYMLIVPVCVWAVLKFIASDEAPAAGYLDTLCLYGYSLFVFGPTAVLCIVPIGLFRWLVIAIAAAISTVFLVTNLLPTVKGYCLEGKSNFLWGVAVLVVVAVCHLGLAVAFKFYFFNYA